MTNSTISPYSCSGLHLHSIFDFSEIWSRNSYLSVLKNNTCPKKKVFILKPFEVSSLIGSLLTRATSLQPKLVSFKVRVKGEGRQGEGEVLGGKRKKWEKKKVEAEHPAPSASSLSLLSHHERNAEKLCIPSSPPLLLYLSPSAWPIRSQPQPEWVTGFTSVGKLASPPSPPPPLLPPLLCLFPSSSFPPGVHMCDSFGAAETLGIQTWSSSGPGQVREDAGNEGMRDSFKSWSREPSGTALKRRGILVRIRKAQECYTWHRWG